MNVGKLKVCVAVAVALFFLPMPIEAQKRTAQRPQRTPSAREIAQKAMRAVVYIRTTDETGHTLATGSGSTKGRRRRYLGDRRFGGKLDP
jgi:hypothetical protein